MKKSILFSLLLVICSLFFSACVENQQSGVTHPSFEQKIIFEYKEKGIKNSFYINESIRLSENELHELMPTVKIVWDKMVAALEQKDIEAAIKYFSPKIQKGFKPILEEMLNTKFDEMIPLFKTTVFSPYQGTSKFIQCNIKSEKSGAPEIVFEKVKNEWKIGFL